MIRRFGGAPEHDKLYTRRPGAYVILPYRGKILLTHQAAPFWEFQLPGGGIDPGESSIRALHREVLEETGWSISKPRLFGIFRTFVEMQENALQAEKICTIYIAHPARRIGLPSEEDHSAHWLPQDLVPNLVKNSGAQHFMRAYLNQIRAR
ncbi:MAG: NUDIX domain-containing protein [Paracoccaceae bacterium]|nr:NUDIX domain-containing protein [Paracoccaceae bacterium]